jgi:hypothetical protein
VSAYLSCADLALAGDALHVISCCDSCHDDVDYGYELFERAIDGRDEVALICCAAARALDGMTDAEAFLARALDAKSAATSPSSATPNP